MVRCPVCINSRLITPPNRRSRRLVSRAWTARPFAAPTVRRPQATGLLSLFPLVHSLGHHTGANTSSPPPGHTLAAPTPSAHLICAEPQHRRRSPLFSP